MRTLLEERDRHFWRSWPLWGTLGGLLLAMACMMWLVLRAQQADTHRQLDAVALKSVEAIEKQVQKLNDANAKLKESDEKAKRERVDIKKDMAEIKQDIKAIPEAVIRESKDNPKATLRLRVRPTEEYKDYRLRNP